MPNIYENSLSDRAKLNIACLAYADDTVWIAKSKKEMEEILAIANSFFELNDIQVNGKKSQLMIINGDKDKSNRKITIDTGVAQAEVQAVEPNEAIRYLGVWLREKKGKRHTINIIKNEIKDVIDILGYKKMTMAHVAYVNNKVIIPRIEYRAKLVYLNEAEATEMQRPVFRIYKHTMGCASTIPNIIITHSALGGVKTISSMVIEHHFTEFNIRLNDQKWLGLTTWARLLTTQRKLGLNNSILLADVRDLLAWKVQDNLNHEILIEMKKQCFEFTPPARQEVAASIGEMKHSLFSVLNAILGNFTKKDAEKYRRSLTTRSDELLTLTDVRQFLTPKSKLLTWKNLKFIKGFAAQGRTPLFYKAIETSIINEERKLLDIYGHIRTEPALTANWNPNAISADKRRKEWVVKIDPYQTLLGKIVSKTSYTQAKVGHVLFSEFDKEHLVKCKGCQFLTEKNEEFDCIFKLSTQTLKEIRVKKLKTMSSNGEEKIGELISPIDNIATWYMRSPTASERRISRLSYVEISPLEVELIKKWIDNEALSQDLINIYEELKSGEDTNPIKIYTDGSLMQKSTQQGQLAKFMGFGWHIEGYNLSACGNLEGFPSSTKPEIMAIMTALLTIPMGHEVEILTDSQAALDGILTALKPSTNRKLFKLTNHIMLGLIKQIIRTKGLKVTWTKIKGHSGNVGNDKADTIAKGITRELMDGYGNIIGIKQKELGINRNVGITWKNFSIDSSIRKFNRLVGNSINNSTWTQSPEWDLPWLPDIWTNQTSERGYHWKGFWEHLRNMNHFKCTNFATHNIFAFILKVAHNLLPTIEKLRIRHPGSKYDVMECPCCKRQDESITHLIECDDLQQQWKIMEEEVITKAWKRLKKYNKKYQETRVTTNRKLSGVSINNSVLGEIIFPYYEQLYSQRSNTIRLEMLKGLWSITTKKKLENIVPKKYVDKFMNKCMRDFYVGVRNHIWKYRNQKMLGWERINGIHSKGRQKIGLYNRQGRDSGVDLPTPRTVDEIREERERKDSKRARALTLAESSIGSYIKDRNVGNWFGFIK